MPRYTVLVHRRVLRFLEGLSDGTTKVKIKDATEKLVNYPLSLRELDAEKLQGAERTFRVRVGRYRLIFYVDKARRTIFITHLGKRESIYEN